MGTIRSITSNSHTQFYTCGKVSRLNRVRLIQFSCCYCYRSFSSHKKIKKCSNQRWHECHSRCNRRHQGNSQSHCRWPYTHLQESTYILLCLLVVSLSLSSTAWVFAMSFKVERMTQTNHPIHPVQQQYRLLHPKMKCTNSSVDVVVKVVDGCAAFSAACCFFLLS